MDCVIQYPPNHQIWHRQSPLPPPPKVQLALEVEHFSDINGIQSGVTELLKGFP